MNTMVRDDLSDVLSRADTCAGRLQRAAYQLLLDHEAAGEIPTNGRFIFYELEGRGVVFKQDPDGPRRGTADRPGPMELIEATTVLRKTGLIPWEWIVDETRTLYDWRSAASVAEYLRDSLELARINPWKDAAAPLLVIEARSTAGVLRNQVGQYVVPIAATNGQVGGFLHTDVIPHLLDHDRDVIYLGDLDLQGAQIEENTRGVIEAEIGRSVAWRRIAITREQVEEHDISPMLKRDHRYRPPKPYEAWECESLGQRRIIDLVTTALDELLPEPLSNVLEREADQKAELEGFLAGMGGAE
ncbi:MAG: hypothetical protein V3T08_09215 [Gemmatimonadota bacterium]